MISSASVLLAFPINLKQMPGNIHFKELRQLEFKLGKVRAEASFINHPGVTVGFRFKSMDDATTERIHDIIYRRIEEEAARTTFLDDRAIDRLINGPKR